MNDSKKDIRIDRRVRGRRINVFKRLMWRVRAIVGLQTDKYPNLHFCLVGKGNEEFVASRKTALTIEGYPRSANSFTREMFLWVNGQNTVIASHLHCSANVRRSVELGKPTVLLVRDPEQAVPSLYLKNPSLSMGLSLRKYITFYTRCLPVADNCVVATFEQVLSDFGAVIRRINNRFGTNFEIFHHTDENVKAVRKHMEEGCRRRRGKVVREWMNLPSKKRAAQKAKALEILKCKKYSARLEVAKDLYKKLVELSQKT